MKISEGWQLEMVDKREGNIYNYSRKISWNGYNESSIR